MPVLGFGVFQVADLKLCEESVLTAIHHGCRLIDTAVVYGNEEAVGAAIRKCDVPREDLFITTKLWVQDAGYENTKAAFMTSLKRLGLDYLDLYLIHRPFGDYYGAWRAMEELYDQGLIRAIGVSNFGSDRLVDLIMNNRIRPAVNQIESHPFFQQEEAREICREYGVQMEAWAPFAEGRQGIFKNDQRSACVKRRLKDTALWFMPRRFSFWKAELNSLNLIQLCAKIPPSGDRRG